MKISERTLDPVDNAWRYVVEIWNSEIEGVKSEAGFTTFMLGVMKQIEDKVVADLYPEIRDTVLQHYLTPETIAEEISKGVRARLAAQLFPGLEVQK